MKHLKIIGLAAVAAMAFMAFVSSASADVLCKAAPNRNGECSTAAGDYAAGTVFTAKATNPKLTVTGSSVGVTSLVCNESNLTLETTTTGGNVPGEKIDADVTGLNFQGDCTTNNGFSCTVTAATGYTLTITATDNKGNGHVVLEKTAGKKTRVSCLGGFFVCEYEAPEGTELTYTGGNPATSTASETKLTTVAGGSGCGSESKWDATYTANGANTAVWIATKME